MRYKVKIPIEACMVFEVDAIDATFAEQMAWKAYENEGWHSLEEINAPGSVEVVKVEE